MFGVCCLFFPAAAAGVVVVVLLLLLLLPVPVVVFVAVVLRRVLVMVSSSPLLTLPFDVATHHVFAQLRLELFDDHMLRRVFFPGETATRPSTGDLEANLNGNGKLIRLPESENATLTVSCHS